MRNLNTRFVQAAAILVATLTFSLTGDAAQSGLTYAIKDARIVTVSGDVIDRGSILMQNGVITAVGASVVIPPDAVVTDGTGLTVYPGVIDMENSAPIETEGGAAAPAGRGGGGGGRGFGGGGQTAGSREEMDREKRAAILRPDFLAAEHLLESSDALTALANAGVTTVLAVPPSGILKGQSALVNVALPPDAPQISTVGSYRRGLAVVKSPVAQHVDVYGRGGGAGFPNSLLGTIGFARQALLDAQWQRDATAVYERTGAKGPRPLVEPSLDALRPALAGQLPVVFDANQARQIDRALKMAEEFGLDPIIMGASEAADRIAELQAAKARVLLAINYPTGGGNGGGRGGGGGGGRGGGPESVRVLRDRANAPKVPAQLAQAGVLFAFTSGGASPADFIRNIGRTIRDGGMTQEAALKAVTLDAARIAGAADRLGSIEAGKIANLVVTEGNLFDTNGRVRHVFIDGLPIALSPPASGAGGGRGRGGGGQR